MAHRHYGRHGVDLSREEKILFPGAGLTKRDLVEHYERVWRRMRSHLAGRPVTLERYPDGVEAQGFYQKQVSEHFPDWLGRVTVAVKSGGEQTMAVVGGVAQLVYLADQAAIAFHTWQSRRNALERPDQLVFDLDPHGDDFAPVRAAALRCRDLLGELELVPVLKTTGSRGLHVVVPLRAEEGFDPVREFARDCAELLARRHPDALTTEQRIARRGRRLYLDVARNAYAQTAVAPYSVRARPGAPVATPISWAELESGGVTARSFAIPDMEARLDRPDPWRAWRRRARGLDEARERLARLAG